MLPVNYIPCRIHNIASHSQTPDSIIGWLFNEKVNMSQISYQDITTVIQWGAVKYITFLKVYAQYTISYHTMFLGGAMSLKLAVAYSETNV